MTSVSAANRSPTSATRRGRVGALKDFELRRATLSPASGASRHRRPAALRGTGEAWSGLRCYAAAHRSTPHPARRTPDDPRRRRAAQRGRGDAVEHRLAVPAGTRPRPVHAEPHYDRGLTVGPTARGRADPSERAPEDRLLLRVSDGERPDDAERRSPHRPGRAVDRSVSGGALLAALPGVRA